MPVSDLLRKAKRPLIHVGQGIRGAEYEFFRLIEEWGIPFVTARNANDIVESDHRLFVGRPGTFGQRAANFAVQTCDLYLAIGTSLSLTQTGYLTKDYARNAQIVQVDIDKAVLDKGTLRDPIKIQMDAREFLRKLLEEHPSNDGVSIYASWIDRCQWLKNKYPVCLLEYKDEKDVNSYCFVETLSEIAEASDIIVTDMGFAFQNTHQAWKIKKGQRLITNCGLAPMGWGLPAAVGAAVATNRRIICITGEGGLMMNIQELATVMHHKLNIKIFVLMNGGYATIKQTQELGFEGRLMGVNKDSGLSFPDFWHIAVAHGIPVKTLHNHDDLRYLGNIIHDDYPCFTQIMMSPDQPQAPRSLNRRNPDGTMNPTKLEDSFPFLPAEEVAECMSTDFWIETSQKTTWRYK